MIAGELYTYPNSRNVFDDRFHTNLISRIEEFEPFVFLQAEQPSLKWVESVKVLTTKGIVGWIHIGYPEKLEQPEKTYGK